MKTEDDEQKQRLKKLDNDFILQTLRESMHKEDRQNHPKYLEKDAEEHIVGVSWAFNAAGEKAALKGREASLVLKETLTAELKERLRS